MFLTKPMLTRCEPLKQATLRTKLHIPLIKLIKKDQVCYSAAPSTTNQNATQRIYIKDIKWLGNPYRHTILKCSMKLYLKVMGGVPVILAFLKLFLLLKLLRRWMLLRVLILGLLRWINVYSRSHGRKQYTT